MSIEHLLGKIHQGDCLEFMKKLPDKCVDLVLTDPPYGINANKNPVRGKHGKDIIEGSDWDKCRPKDEVFKEVLRIGKNSIIWGGNYFADLLPPSMGWLCWDKGTREFSLADGELAYTTYNKAMRLFTLYRGAATNQDGRTHPTQKPEALMRWCLNEIAKKEIIEGNGIVFDPFMGSGTTAVACERLGRKWFGCELEPKYVEIANKRIEQERAQLKLF